MYVEDKCVEIQEALRPLLKVLQLEPFRDPYFRRERLVFERQGEGQWRSPVEVIFADPEYVNLEGETSWEHVRLCAVEVETFPIGTNGWTAHNFVGRHLVETSPTREGIIKQCALLLRQLPLRPTAELPFVLNDTRLGRAWPEIKEELDCRDVTDVSIEARENGKANCYFEFCGTQFELCFDYPDARLVADGVEVGRHRADTPSGVSSMLSSCLTDICPRY